MTASSVTGTGPGSAELPLRGYDLSNLIKVISQNNLTSIIEINGQKYLLKSNASGGGGGGANPWTFGTGPVNSAILDLGGNIASGKLAVAEGYITHATGNASHSEGIGSIASGAYSHAEGNYSVASGAYSHAEGSTTVANYSNSHAEGGGTHATGNASHAEGSSTTASGYYSHAEGLRTTALGKASHAEGNYTNASSYSHAEGSYTNASGIASHAEGFGNIASGNYSHAEGGLDGEGVGPNTASGTSSHAEGIETLASGSYSHSGGYASNANHWAQFARAAGKFATIGDAQQSSFTLRASSSASGTSEMFLDGVSLRLTIEVNKAYNCFINIIGETPDSLDAASYLRRVTIRNHAGSTALIGSVDTIGADKGTNAGVPPATWTVTITADNTHDALIISVTGGEGGPAVNWVARVDTVEIGV